MRKRDVQPTPFGVAIGNTDRHEPHDELDRGKEPSDAGRTDFITFLAPLTRHHRVMKTGSSDGRYQRGAHLRSMPHSPGFDHFTNPPPPLPIHPIVS